MKAALAGEFNRDDRLMEYARLLTKGLDDMPLPPGTLVTRSMSALYQSRWLSQQEDLQSICLQKTAYDIGSALKPRTMHENAFLARLTRSSGQRLCVAADTGMGDPTPDYVPHVIREFSTFCVVYCAGRGVAETEAIHAAANCCHAGSKVRGSVCSSKASRSCQFGDGHKICTRCFRTD